MCPNPWALPAAAVSYFAIANDNTITRRKEILPAGWGMKDVQLLILTPNGSVAGIGELGEIYVRRCVNVSLLRPGVEYCKCSSVIERDGRRIQMSL